MIHADQTKVAESSQGWNLTHVWVTCDWCGHGRWVVASGATKLADGQLCRSCSNKRAWNGKRIDLSDGMKRCVDCGEYKVLDEFSADSRKRGGVRSYCLECAAQRSREYRRLHPKRSREAKRIAQAKRRAEKHKSNGSFTAEDWQEVLERYGHKCLCCGATEDLQPDHVVALSTGGAHDISNIQPLCGLCNRRKQAETIDYR